ncbi:hypothetical protein SESBI_49044 [Sesbania bispinosa]|nr:hypothetical protein SESBI_49044 [Sesbania bispinosa]
MSFPLPSPSSSCFPLKHMHGSENADRVSASSGGSGRWQAAVIVAADGDRGSGSPPFPLHRLHRLPLSPISPFPPISPF